MSYTLVVGNKNYSSWSLRAYLALVATGAEFDEVVIPLYRPESKSVLREHSPSARVPVLRAGDLVIWDSLAIGEYLAERHPEAVLWPADSDARALARAVTAEMHSGFAPLRDHLPMDLRAHHPGRGVDQPGVSGDIWRITGLWRQLREQYEEAGPYLFGAFSLADCAYAPVATRFRSYGVELDPICAAYVDTIYSMPAFERWYAEALEEPWTIGD